MNPSLSLKVDVRNPGQYYACCGLLELADAVSGCAAGWFDGGCFHCATAAQVSLAEIAESAMEEADGSEVGKLRPIHLASIGLTLDWWLTNRARSADPSSWDEKGKNKYATPLKLWGGRQASRVNFNHMIGLCRRLGIWSSESPFDVSERAQRTFGVDPRSAWTSLDKGHSTNDLAGKLKEYDVFPAVELLAVVGLQRFRPVKVPGQWAYRYHTWRAPLHPSPASAAGSGLVPHASGRYKFRLISRGQGYRSFCRAVVDPVSNVGNAEEIFA